MSGVRPNRNISTLQVGSLRYDRSSIPANGGMLVVDGQGKLTVESEVSVEKITASSVVNTAVLNADAATITGATITNLEATNLVVTGLTTLDQLNVMGDADISGALIATDVTVRDALLVANTLEVTGTALFMDDVTINAGLSVDVNELVTTGKIIATEIHADFLDVSGLKVGNNIDVSGNFSVEQTSTFRGPVYFEENIDVSGSAIFRSQVTFKKDIIIEGAILDVDITDAEFIRMDRGFMTNLRVGDRKSEVPFAAGVALDVSGGASVTGGATVARGVVVSSGNIVIQSGGVSMSGGATVGNLLNVTGGGASVTGGATVAGGAIVSSGNIVIQSGGVSMSGGATVGNLLNVTGGGASVTGGATVAGGAIVSSGNIVIQSGGVSMSGGATVGNLLNVTGGGASVTGGATVAGGVTVSSGNIVIQSGGVSMSGAATVGNLLNITGGGASVTGGATVAGGVTVSSGSIVVQNGGALIKYGLQIDNSGAIIAEGITVTNGGAEITGGLIVYDSTTLNGNLTVTNGITLSSGNIIVQSGGVSMSGAATIGGGATVSSGNIIVQSGGVSMSGAATVGNLLNVVAGGASVTGGATVASGVTVTSGNIVIQSGGVSMSGTATIGNLLNVVAGGASITGGVTLSTGNMNIVSGSLSTQRVAVTTDGIPSAPSIYWENSDSTNTGINHISNGTLAFVTNNSIRSYITPSGLSVVDSLDVTGNASAERIVIKNNGAPNQPSLYWSTDTSQDTGLNHPDDGQISVITNGSERMRVTPTCVGIGTPEPVATLDVVGASTTFEVNETANNNFMIGTGKDPADQVLYMGTNKTSSYSYIQSVKHTIATSPLLLNARGGNVGIGTATPATTLDVAGEAKVNQLAIVGNGSTSSPSIYWTQDTGESPVNNTGINHPSNNVITLVTGGNERMRVNDDSAIFYSSNSVNSASIQAKYGTSSINILNNTVLGSYNPLTQAGDNMIFSDNNHDFVIAKQDGAGLRITTNDITVKGDLKVSLSPSPLSLFQLIPLAQAYADLSNTGRPEQAWPLMFYTGTNSSKGFTPWYINGSTDVNIHIYVSVAPRVKIDFWLFGVSDSESPSRTIHNTSTTDWNVILLTNPRVLIMDGKYDKYKLYFD